VSKSLLQNRVLQGLDNMVLAQNIVENLGSIFSGKDLIAHIYNVARICPVPQESERPAALQSFQPGSKIAGCGMFERFSG
jgi:hypothetical protein